MPNEQTEQEKSPEKPHSTDLREKLRDGISDLLQLTVVTAVGDVQLERPSKDGNWAVSPDSIKSSAKMFTKIGLLDGDIETAMDDAFRADETYKELRDHHLEMVNKGQSIVESNIATLSKLITDLWDKIRAPEK